VSSLETQLTGRFIVVTGGSSGIGLATSQALASQGAQVIAVGRDFEPNPSDVIELVADLSTQDGVDLALAGIREHLAESERIGLVHAAAVSHLGPMIGLEPSLIDEVLAVNVAAPMKLVSGLVEHFEVGSSVVLLGSRAAVGPAGCNATYAASKAAVRSLALSMREELSTLGISVTEVIPGVTPTKLRARALDGLSLAVERAQTKTPGVDYGKWVNRFHSVPVPEVEVHEVAREIVAVLQNDSPPQRVYVPASERLKVALRGGPTSVSAKLRNVRSRFRGAA